MRFKDASKIHEAVERMRLANYPVARNRAKVNDLFNGNPPWSEDERSKGKIFTNVNPLYGTRIAHSARQNMNNAILKPGHYFDVSLDTGPVHKRTEWGHIISEEANRKLKRCQAYTDMWDATNAQVVLHGIGPVWWSGRENPIPLELGIEDVLVPAQTYLNFSNLEFFGVYRQWTYAELYDMTHGKNVDRGWNMALVTQLLASLADQPLQSTVMGQRWLFPEKLAEDLKENAGLFMTSAAPTLFIWDFYFRDHDESDNEKWNRRIVLDYMQMQPEAMRASLSTDAKTNFLYQKDDYCGPLAETMHFQVGNCSNVAPFRYYSVRSLGFLLFAVCQLQNRLYCRFSDSTFANLLELFRNVGEDDRERLEKVDLWHMGIVPDGLSFVTAAERHEINEQQTEMLFAMNKQLMGESSATWMPEIDTGTQKEQTLGEAQIRLQTTASLSSALLNQCYGRAEFMYREQCRRLSLKGSRNAMAKDFQERVQRRGVPLEMLDVEAWEVRANRVLGGGNKAMEGMQADKLMQARGAYGADAQEEILYLFTLANTDDAALAAKLVPMGQDVVSDAAQIASLAFGTLMAGVPVAVKQGISEVEFVKTLAALSGQVLQQLEQLEQADVQAAIPLRMEKVAGLANVLETASQHLQVVMGDPSNQDLVAELQRGLEQMQGALQKMAQHLDEEIKKSQPTNLEMQETMARIQAMMAETQATLQSKAVSDQQKRQHKDAQWAGDQERKNAAAQMEQQRKTAAVVTGLEHEKAKTMVGVATQAAESQAKVEAMKKESDAKVEAMKKQAEAQAAMAKKKTSASKNK